LGNWVISLKYGSIRWTDTGSLACLEHYGCTKAIPHPEDHHYHVIAHRCGYGDDLPAYCREHDFTHIFLCDRLLDSPSPVLAAQCLREAIDANEVAFEELAVQAFQRWLRANEEPIVAGIDWQSLKREALELLNAENERARQA
jgi:hypothetical protein